MYWIGGIIASLIGFYFGYRRGKAVGFVEGWYSCEKKNIAVYGNREKKENE